MFHKPKPISRRDLLFRAGEGIGGLALAYLLNQDGLLAASCDDAASGRMPGVYAAIRPQTRLSQQDIKTICAAAGQAPSRTAGVSR